MTFEELKAYRAKCVEVQNTLIRDCEYIKKDIHGMEERILTDWDSIVKRIGDYLELLPKKLHTSDDKGYILYEIGTDEKTFVVGDTRIRFGIGYDEKYFTIAETRETYSNPRGCIITAEGDLGYDKYYHHISTCDPDFQRALRLKICRNWAEFEKGFQEFVERINKKMNNLWIATNKYMLDKAEGLTERQ